MQYVLLKYEIKYDIISLFLVRPCITRCRRPRVIEERVILQIL